MFDGAIIKVLNEPLKEHILNFSFEQWKDMLEVFPELKKEIFEIMDRIPKTAEQKEILKELKSAQ